MKNTGRMLKIACNQMTRNFDRFAEQFGLTSTQMSVIDYLTQHPNQEVLQRDIEHEFNIQRSTTAVLLKRMERNNLLYRDSSTKDTRQKSVYLTPEAAKLSQKITSYLDAQQTELTTHFSQNEIQNFEKILNYYIDKEKNGYFIGG